MDFQFVIPSTNSDLLNSNGNNYFVKQVYDAKEIPDRLKAARNAFSSSDPFYIFDHFDTFFSIIENAGNTTIMNIIRANDLMFSTVHAMGNILTSQLQNNEIQNRNSLLNLTKMNLFLSIGLVRAVDLQIDGQQSHKKGGASVGGQSSSKKQQHATDYDYHEWDNKRFKFLVQLFNVFNLPLDKLWPDSVTEDDFVNMICEICYRTIENTTIKEKRIINSVFQIFGLAIKRYNHALSFPIRIIQIIRTTESAIEAIAQGIHILYEEFEITSIFSVILKDLIDSLCQDASDSQTSKCIAKFLTELGTIAPKLIIPHLSVLSEEMLNLDLYILRNCILQIMGDVITCELSSEELTDELKEIRDDILEDLLCHMEDVSAHVRSKVLQIWNHMKTENAVPLAYQQKVLQIACERLDDKTCLVRKNAVILIKSFLEMNPFAAKLSLEELKERYNSELDKLNDIRQKLIDRENQLVESNNKWDDEISIELFPIVKEMLTQNTQLDEYGYPQEFTEHAQKISEALNCKKFHEAVALVIKADCVAGNRSARLEFTFDQQCAYYMELIKSYLFVNIQDFTNEYKTQDQTVKFLNDSISFSQIITKTVPKIENMLLSKTNTDVFEAIDFFTTAYLFGIKGTECGMRKILFLVWSGDKEKHDGTTKAFHRILFVTDAEGRAHSIKVVDNLCNFLENITLGHYQAMEVLMHEWIECAYINSQIIQVMFERFTLKLPDTTENQSRLALQLLVMASVSKPSIATANIDLLISIGLGERGFKDHRIYSSCLNLLMNLAPQNIVEYHKRYDCDHEIIDKVIKIFTQFFFVPDINNFDVIITRTFDFIYHLCLAPDILCQNLLRDLCSKLNGISDKQQPIATATQSNAIESDTEGSQSSITTTTSSSPNWHLPLHLITRIVYLIGYIAMKEMIYLDISVYSNMKYRQDLKEKKKKNNKRKTITTLNISSASNVLKRLSGTAAEPQQEPDEMLLGATAEDSIADLINVINEKELLYSTIGILPKFIPIIMEILKSPAKYRDINLQQAACLALIRFMSISSKFCEDKMQFLMNILNASKNIKMKCNIVIGLSDFTFRYPNVIEPWTGHFYAILHEENDELRLAVVKMLSHLISHEMIRVKGQISDLAMCIVDPNNEICNITKQFFKEIANKSNILYNVLPDIISRLSDTNLHLEEEKYHQIMHYIIGLIHKDREVEKLVEKLCLRFRVTNEERQWRDIAYCLSLLNYTEKTIKKLNENIQYFKDKVIIDEVYDSFKKIIAATLKSAKPELKTLLSDFENKLQECLAVRETEQESGGGGDEEHQQQNPNRSSGLLMPPPSARNNNNRQMKRGKKIVNNPKKKVNRHSALIDSDSDDSDFEQNRNASPSPSQQQQQQRSVTRPQRSLSKRKNNRESDDSDDDEDNENNEKDNNQSKTQNANKNRRGRRII